MSSVIRHRIEGINYRYCYVTQKSTFVPWVWSDYLDQKTYIMDLSSNGRKNFNFQFELCSKEFLTLNTSYNYGFKLNLIANILDIKI